MSSEVQDVIDVFRMQYTALESKMFDKGIKRERFDRYSISKWAIGESLQAIDAYPGEITEEVLMELLEIQMMDYVEFSNKNDPYKRFDIASDMIEQLIKIVNAI